MSNELKGFIYAVVSSVLYGLLPYFGKPIFLLGLSNSTMLFWRFLLSFLILALCCPRDVFILKSIRKFPFFLAIMFFSLSSFFYFESWKFIGVGLSMTVFFIYPVVLVLLNYVYLKEKSTPHQKWGMLFAMLSVLCLCDGEFSFTSQGFNGIILALLGGASYAAYAFFTKSTGLHASTLTAWVCLGNLLVFWGILLWDKAPLSIPALSLWADLSCMALICTVLPVLFFIKAVTLIGNVKASLLSITEPATALFIGIYFFGETLTSLQLLGTFFMIISLVTIEGQFLFGRFLSSKKTPLLDAS